MHYVAYGHVVASAAALPGLPPSTAESADVTIDLTADPAPAVRWPVAPTPGVDPWLQVARTSEGCVLRFDAAVTFSVTPDGRTIRLHHDGPLTDTIWHLLVDQVLPLVIAHRGRLVLHGAGLRWAGRGVALVGPSGAGKSTLAGSLASRGAVVFADDALVMDAGVDRARAHPAYPGLRLWPDVLAAIGVHDGAPRVADYTEKRRVTLTTRRADLDGPVRLDRVYVVEPEPSPTIRIVPLTKRHAVMALLTHSYVLDPSDTEGLSRQFDAACALAGRCVVRALRYPRDLARLADVSAALDDDLRT